MNLYIKKIIWIGLFVVFISPSFASDTRGVIYGGSCSDSVVACVSVVSDKPVYQNSDFNSPEIDSASAISAKLYIANVDITNWDFDSFGMAFHVEVRGGAVQTINDNFYMLESDGPANFLQLANYYVKSDKIRDTREKYYLLFSNDGKVEQTKGNFINMGFSEFREGSEYVYSPTDLDDIFYADVLQIGGDGGSTSLSVEGHIFAFYDLYIKNATLTLKKTETVVITDTDKKFNMLGNVNIVLDLFEVDNKDFKSELLINVKGDNNVITALESSLEWNDFGPSSGYVDGNGPSMQVLCSSTCTNNLIDLDLSQLHFSTFHLENVDEFNVNMIGSESNVEHYEIINSNLIVTVAEYSEFMTSASSQLTSFDDGTLFIDANSSFTINAQNSQIHFFSTAMETQGDFVINMDETTLYFDSTIDIKASKKFEINLVDSQISSHELNMISGQMNINLKGDSSVQLIYGISGDAGGEIIFDVANNGFIDFGGKFAFDKDVKTVIYQEVYSSGVEHTLLRFFWASVFLDDRLEYHYKVNFSVKNNDFNVRDPKGTVILIQVRNEGPAGDFPSDTEQAIIDKINEAGKLSGGDGGDGGGDGGDSGGGGDIGDINGDGSLSVLIDFEADTRSGGSFNSAYLVDYKFIGGSEYAEFGIGVVGGGGGDSGGGGDDGGGVSGHYVYNLAQDQYGEESGLLTLTTMENINGYGIAVVFDNIVLSDTDKEDYRVTLLNLVINNSRTVEQLGQTLNSLSSNMTLSNILYSSSILELNDKKNASTLLGGQRFTTYSEIRNLTSDDFAGNYLAFGAALTVIDSDYFRLGVSGFYSPYASNTIYDGEEKSNNVGASAFFAIQVGGAALMFDASVMQSAINGEALVTLNPENKRSYNYNVNAANATVSLNFGSYFSQRMIVSAFARQSVSYEEANNSSDLRLQVTTPSYRGAFAGYYSKLLDNKKIALEFGIKYFFKEEQEAGMAGFINDPSGQRWNYQYVLLDSAVEINIDFTYKMLPSLEFKTGFNKRGAYNNFGIHIMYKKALGVEPEADNYYSVGGIVVDL